MPTPRQPAQIRKCACGELFKTTKGSTKKYCSDKCRERAKKKNLYEKRRVAGLCPQCGGELTRSTGRRGEYCDFCANKFHRYHESRK